MQHCTSMYEHMHKTYLCRNSECVRTQTMTAYKPYQCAHPQGYTVHPNYECILSVMYHTLRMHPFRCGGFSSLARTLGECSSIRSSPKLLIFLFKKKEVEISPRTLNSTPFARITPQWLSELRRLWPNAL